ncbi:protein of unknown function [Salinibacillus kushneri]|uniref:DUF5067 domain-containing protein n=1 Tax=Salinibacillus kushneri TaxID=237682 RepID=A0A1I0J4E7_9BACI|nr:DUF5067 domain-containing protein [Salinibacillus kushneri]SEU03973.1 protein of unknown function [Salinibacillus kushneri]
MKKLIGFALLVLLLAACGGDGESETSGENATEPETKETSEEETETSNEVFENEDYKFVFGESEQLEGVRGNQVLAIEVEFTNKSDVAESPWMASTIPLSISEVSDVTTETVMGAVGGLPEDYKSDLYRMDEKINSGETVKAILAFELQSPGADIEIVDSKTSGEKFKRIYNTSE